MKTREHNAALKRLRLINEARRAKSAPEGPTVGQRFGNLVALEPAGVDARGNRRWTFECDCGARLTWRVSTVTYNLRRLGWGSCPECYRRAGGWSAIAALHQVRSSPANETRGSSVEGRGAAGAATSKVVTGWR